MVEVAGFREVRPGGEADWEPGEAVGDGPLVLGVNAAGVEVDTAGVGVKGWP